MAKGHSLTGALLCGLVGPLIPSPMSPVAAVLVSAIAGSFLALLMDLDTRGKAYYLLGEFPKPLLRFLRWLPRAARWFPRPVEAVLAPVLKMLAFVLRMTFKLLGFVLPVLPWAIRGLLVWVSQVIYQVTRGEKDPPQKGMHRMFTHQPEFALLLALLALWGTWGTDWTWWATVTVFVGVWAHRPGDACTKAGVPISLTRVIVRAATGQQRVWLTKGIPPVLRFIAGGQRGVAMFGARSRRLWDTSGETVVTFALAMACCGLGVATAAGLYPAW